MAESEAECQSQIGEEGSTCELLQHKKPTRKPDAGNPPVRFEEGEGHGLSMVCSPKAQTRKL
jgi:hypothetical protein